MQVLHAPAVVVMPGTGHPCPCASHLIQDAADPLKTSRKLTCGACGSLLRLGVWPCSLCSGRCSA